MKFKKEIIIASISIISIVILLTGVEYLKNQKIWSSKQDFYVLYEKVEGLAPSAQASINGFKIGQVNNIHILNDYSGRLLVHFSITEKDFNLPIGTKIRLISTSIVGTKGLSLVFPKEIDTFHKNKDTLVGEIENTLFESFSPIKDQAELFLNNAYVLLGKLNDLLDPNTIEQLKKSTNSMAFSLKQSENIVTKADQLMSNLLHSSKVIKEIDLAKSMHNIDQTFNELKKTLHHLNQGEGTLGQLVKNDSLYYSLHTSIKNLDNLLIDLKKNPKRYLNFSVFGGKK